MCQRVKVLRYGCDGLYHVPNNVNMEGAIQHTQPASLKARVLKNEEEDCILHNYKYILLPIRKIQGMANNTRCRYCYRFQLLYLEHMG